MCVVDVALVAPPQLDAAPVDVARDGLARDLAVDRVGDRAAGQADPGHLAGGLRVLDRVQQCSGDGAGERDVVGLDDDLGGGHLSASFTIRFTVRA